MKNLIGVFRMAKFWFRQQIAMALPKGVVNFSQDGGQRIVRSMAIPKADGLEGIAQHSGKCLKPNFSLGIMDVFTYKQLFYPGSGAAVFGLAAIAMIGIKKRQQARSVDGQCCLI